MADDNYKSGYYGEDIDQAVSLAKNALSKSGGAMTGALILNGTPTVDLHAATKKYVDDVARGAVTIPALNGRCAYNLLDNSWFVNPINQRGQTSYTAGGYTIDRWRNTNNNGTAAVNPDGLQYKSTSGGASYLTQYIPSGVLRLGQTYSLAICDSDGKITVRSGALIEDVSIKTFYPMQDSTGSQIGVRLTYDTNKALHNVTLSTSNTLPYTVKWIALYEGEYTVETLPPYVYKGYAVELAECQRYFYRLKSYWKWAAGGICTSATEAYIPITLPQSMRAMPAVTIADKSLVKIRCGAVASQVPSALDWGNVDTMYRMMHLKVTVNGATTGDVAFLYMDNAAIIDFSADL